MRASMMHKIQCNYHAVFCLAAKKLNDLLHIETAYNKDVYTSVSSYQSLQGANVLILFLDFAF